MSALYRDREAADAAVDKLKTYAQPQRLMILSCLFEGERTVSEIETATGIGQPALSQQLAELRRTDLVKTRRVSKQVYYDLANDSVRLCVRSMEAIFGGASDPAVALQLALRSESMTTPAHSRPACAAAFARIG